MPSVADPATGRLPSEQTSNGCFETMRAYGGRIFRLEQHLDRLKASAQTLGLSDMVDRRQLAVALIAQLKNSGLPDAIVRIALMPQRVAGDHLPTRVQPSIVVQPLQLPPERAYRQGISVAVVPTKKFPISMIDPQVKYSARMSSVMALTEAHLRGVEEALFLDALGSVTESTASNFGLIHDGALLTPPCWLGLLSGITRDVLCELARDLHLPMREVPLTRHEVYSAQEAFLTSTIKEVLPVTVVDGRTIGTGRPGPVTKRLRRAFQELVRRELKLKR